MLRLGIVVHSPVLDEVTERWAMSFHAGVGDNHPSNYDDRDPVARPLVAHPLHYWALTWTQFVAAGGVRDFFDEPVPEPAALRAGVHFREDAVFARPLRAGDRLRFACTVFEAEQKERGAVVGLRFDFFSAPTPADAATAPATATAIPQPHGSSNGCEGKERKEEVKLKEEELVITQWLTVFFIGLCLHKSIAAGVRVAGIGPPPVLRPRPGMEATPKHIAGNSQTLGRGDCCAEEQPLVFGPAAAHVYTECARIYNPIHTSRRAARVAGLGKPLLHGTAVLTKCVSAILDRFACRCGSSRRSTSGGSGDGGNACTADRDGGGRELTRPADASTRRRRRQYCTKCPRSVARGECLPRATILVVSCTAVAAAAAFVSCFGLASLAAICGPFSLVLLTTSRADHVRCVRAFFVVCTHASVQCSGFLAPAYLPATLTLRTWVRQVSHSCLLCLFFPYFPRSE